MALGSGRGGRGDRPLALPLRGGLHGRRAPAEQAFGDRDCVCSARGFPGARLARLLRIGGAAAGPAGIRGGGELHARGGSVGSNPGTKGLMEHGFTWLHGLPIPEHVAGAILIGLLLIVFALRVRPKLVDTEAAIQPEEGGTARNVAEVVVEAISGLAEGVIGHGSERRVPLLAAFFVFILLANLLGLVPGFLPPTSNFNTTLALGLVSFLAYNAYGIQEHGVGGHFRELLGPVIWIAPLMLVVELFSQSFRPISLGIRLFANMFADHEVVSVLPSLTKLVIPVAFYVLGAFVAVVQAFVFTMLSAIYISLATAHQH